MPFRNQLMYQGYTGYLLLEILNPTGGLVTDCRANTAMLNNYGTIEQPAAGPGWVHKRWQAGTYWYPPLIAKTNTNAVIKTKAGILVCDGQNYSISPLYFASIATIPKIYAKYAYIKYRPATSNTVISVDLRTIFSNIIFEPWTSNMEGIFINQDDDLSSQAATIRTWAETAGNIFINISAASVLGFSLSNINTPNQTPYVHLLTANYTKPFQSGDQVSTQYAPGWQKYRSGTIASGWTSTDLMKCVVSATDYFLVYYARKSGTSHGGIVELLTSTNDGERIVVPEEWIPIYVMQLPLYLGEYLADAYVEDS